jgi:3'-phosphoadenosine 5'-phosphosulfate sulfotransferase (PAPS reductase)/FAD synthetase
MAEKWYHLIEQDFNISNKCCEVLKHEPIRRFEKVSGLKSMSGIMAEESDQRQQTILDKGYISKDKCRPLGFWTEADIWEFSRVYNFKFAENYYDRWVNGVFVQGDKRSGCRFCFMGFARELQKRNRGNLFYQNRLQIEKLTNPKYEKLLNVKNNGVTVREALKITFGLKDGEI